MNWRKVEVEGLPGKIFAIKDGANSQFDFFTELRKHMELPSQNGITVMTVHPTILYPGYNSWNDVEAEIKQNKKNAHITIISSDLVMFDVQGENWSQDFSGWSIHGFEEEPSALAK